MDYSQYGEQEKILSFFAGNTDGMFVDIGAADGVRFSNTRALWELGWSGVLIEACLPSFIELSKNYEGSDRVTLINAAISESIGIVKFYRCKNEAQWSSMDQRWIESWKDIAEEVRVIGLRLDTLGLKSPDFLSIDTEGMDLTILRTMPPDFRPRLICAETDKFDDGQKIDEFLRSIGYKPVWSDIGNGAWEYPATVATT